MAKDNSLIKVGHAKQRFTEKDLQDFAQCQNDPHFFLDNFFYIQHPTKGKLKYKAFEYQTRLIDSYHNYRFNVNLLPRQTGKCVTGDSYIRVRQKSTGKVFNIPIQEYFRWITGQKNGTPIPDISIYEVKQ